MKNKEQLTPSDAAFNKLFFVNIFAGEHKCKDFAECKFRYPKLATIAEKLTHKELEYLIEKIESVQ